MTGSATRGRSRPVERAVAIHEAHDVGRCREQTGKARRAEASTRLDDHARAEAARDCRGLVDGTVVDDDRLVVRGQAREHGRERQGFVERGEYDVRHRRST